MSTLAPQDLYLSSFTRLESGFPGQDVDWLKTLRLRALEEFKKTGFPTEKLESWKYTNLSLDFLKVVFTFENFQSATNVVSQLKKAGFDVEKSHLIVFVNGKFSRSLSSLKPLTPGVMVQNLSSAFSHHAVKAFLGQVAPMDHKTFHALNMAFFTDGLFVHLEAGKMLEAPIHVVYLSTNGHQTTQSHVRNLIVLGRDSKMNILEHYWGENVSAYFTNGVTEAVLEPGSSLDHTQIVQEDAKGYHIGSLMVQQKEGSHLNARLFSVGGSLIRTDIETSLSEKKADCVLEGLYLGKKKQHIDTRTFIDHLSSHCTSHEVFKGVMDEQATGIFDGRVLVRENAQKTDAHQSNKNLLLSPEAKVYSKPQLQIYADDVKCTHGSATGQIDEEALFYLQSRGIDRVEAKRLLVYAFAGEMVERIENSYLKPALKKIVDDWMEVS